MWIKSRLLNASATDWVDSLRDQIDFEPDYQREGGIWSLEMKQLLIDSIINGFDVPKFYVHAVGGPTDERGIQYAVIDGKQRLGAILEFFDGSLLLAADCHYYLDPSVEIGGLGLAELEQRYPYIANAFHKYRLHVIEVQADSVELIEELFQRLNTASNLNAAEYRNAIGGPARDAVRRLAGHRFFTECVPVKNTRYRHREFATKMLVLTRQLATTGLKGTRKDVLDAFFRDAKPTATGPARITGLDVDTARAEEALERLAEVFGHDDRLLSSVGTVIVYFLIFAQARSSADVPAREHLAEFEELRRGLPGAGEAETGGIAVLRAYNALVLSANDGRALASRAKILSAYAAARKSGVDPDRAVAGLVDLAL